MDARVGCGCAARARAEDDGYRSRARARLRASTDALRLVEEISFAAGRLLALEADPPGLYGRVRELAGGELERASWICFLIAYLSPLEADEPFAGVEQALAEMPDLQAVQEQADLEEIPLGPRSSHDPVAVRETLLAYRQWVAAQRSMARRRRLSRAIPAGAPSVASSVCSSAWLCRASVAWGAMNCS